MPRSPLVSLWRTFIVSALLLTFTAPLAAAEDIVPRLTWCENGDPCCPPGGANACPLVEDIYNIAADQVNWGTDPVLELLGWLPAALLMDLCGTTEPAQCDPNGLLTDLCGTTDPTQCADGLLTYLCGTSDPARCDPADPCVTLPCSVDPSLNEFPEVHETSGPPTRVGGSTPAAGPRPVDVPSRTIPGHDEEEREFTTPGRGPTPVTTPPLTIPGVTVPAQQTPRVCAPSELICVASFWSPEKTVGGQTIPSQTVNLPGVPSQSIRVPIPGWSELSTPEIHEQTPGIGSESVFVVVGVEYEIFVPGGSSPPVHVGPVTLCGLGCPSPGSPRVGANPIFELEHTLA